MPCNPENNLRVHVKWLVDAKANIAHFADIGLTIHAPEVPSALLQLLPNAAEDKAYMEGTEIPARHLLAMSRDDSGSSQRSIHYSLQPDHPLCESTSGSRNTSTYGPLTPVNYNALNSRKDITMSALKINAESPLSVLRIDLSSDDIEDTSNDSEKAAVHRRTRDSPRKSPSKRRRPRAGGAGTIVEDDSILDDSLTVPCIPENRPAARNYPVEVQDLDGEFVDVDMVPGTYPDLVAEEKSNEQVAISLNNLFADDDSCTTTNISAKTATSSVDTATIVTPCTLRRNEKEKEYGGSVGTRTEERLKDALLSAMGACMAILEQSVAIATDWSRPEAERKAEYEQLIPEFNRAHAIWQTSEANLRNYESSCRKQSVPYTQPLQPADEQMDQELHGENDGMYLESLPSPEDADFNLTAYEEKIDEYPQTNGDEFIDIYDDINAGLDLDMGSEYFGSSPAKQLADAHDVPEIQVRSTQTTFPNRITVLDDSDDEFGNAYVNPAKQMARVGVYDSTDSEMCYEWSREVCSVLRDVFKLPGFRRNQLEAINATLAGRDVFVLMPTGGGKSLCYQLPALVFGGKTKGTTIVISPLISLMQDQVEHLLEKGIKAAMVSSRGDAAARRNTFQQLKSGDLSLLYVSPEMLTTNSQLRNVISSLYHRNSLARIVIDEAHCVSSWGHDFRPDYKQLGQFKEDFPNVPLIALTATANERVRLDIVFNLKITGCALFTQSFNRPNLYYEVRDKQRDVLAEIKELMKVKYPGKSGIIYCHSKNSCEETATKLNRLGLKVTYYHAGMDPEERLQVQIGWQEGRYQAICATVAFGMGIDKADVRFVIHYTLPRNLEGYYQETGRAGRDGLPSECILYYAYRDATSIMTMIDRDKDIDYDTKEKQRTFLKQVLQYCENQTDCRRHQVLQYFNEKFDSKDCRNQCDNCRIATVCEFETRDITEVTKDIIRTVLAIQGDNVTMLHCMDVFRGAKTAKIQGAGHNNVPGYAAGKDVDRTDMERIFHHLVAQSILKESAVVNRSGFATSYLRVGSRGVALLSGTEKLSLTFLKNGAAKKSKLPAKPVNSASNSSGPKPKATKSTKSSSRTNRSRFGVANAQYRRITKQSTAAF
ncbi:hypothetical protein V1525DRAFT_353098 [Lipomyces kononenkoae]|uniref:Uncharacterized protein n=1 Tax=Lipomyces kononenkoae TaxID=34357 RepID=A0ACC3TB39_LIPKO